MTQDHLGDKRKKPKRVKLPTDKRENRWHTLSELPYGSFVREERHVCAILFHLLQDRDTAKLFLDMLDLPVGHAEKEMFGVYVEYSRIRDMWRQLGEWEDESDSKEALNRINKRRRDVVVNLLGYLGLPAQKISSIPTSSNEKYVEEFNNFFGTSHTSSDHIESPSNWTLENLDNCDKTYLAAFTLRACFNLKPDIVIELPDNKLICIEAKFESKLGSYSLVRSSENLPASISQIEMQRMAMEQVLGKDVTMVYLGLKALHESKEGGLDHNLTWNEVFREIIPDRRRLTWQLKRAIAYVESRS